MKNQTLRIELPKLNMGLAENQNSYIVRGNSADGYINQAVLKEDPECREKVQGLLEAIYRHQASQLAEFAQSAPDQMDSQYSELQDVFNAEFESDEE